MWKKMETIRESVLSLENFEHITAFNEVRDISCKLIDGICSLHTHDVFEVRILFRLMADGEVDYSRIEDIHITPPYRVHVSVDYSEFKRLVCMLVSAGELTWGENGKGHYIFSSSALHGKKISPAEFAFPASALMSYWVNKEHDPEHLRLIIAMLLSLLSKLAKEEEERINYSPADAIAAYIRTNYHRTDLSVSEIAEKHGFSPNYIQKVFRAKCDCTLIEYIKNTRLSAARLLLHQHRWQVKEVAAMCGFTYVHYFCKCYRKHFGNLPSEE